MSDFKLVFSPSLERSNEDFEQGFETLEEAELALNVIANYTLHLHDENLMRDDSNLGMVFERMSDGSWEEVDGDGNRI